MMDIEEDQWEWFHLLWLRMETIVSVRKILMMEILLYMDMDTKAVGREWDYAFSDDDGVA